MSTTRGGARRALSMVKLLGAVVGVLVVAGGGWLVMAQGGGAGEQQRSSDIALAQVRDFDITTLAGGDLEARNQIEIRSELEKQSTIVELVPEGTRVHRGELLVRLNGDELEDTIAEEELRVEEASLALEAAKTDVQIQHSDNESKQRKAELDLELKKLALQQWREGEDKQTRQANELAIERAQRELERLTDKWTQTQELYKKEFVSKNEYDQDRLAYIEAKAELEKAQLNDIIYREYQYPRDEKQRLSDVDEAGAELDRVEQQNEINLKAKESARANKERQLTMHQEKLDDLKDQLSKCTIHAPSDGLVVYGSTAQRDNWRWQSEGPLAIGRQVGPNDLLIVLPDTSEMIASVKVHESLAGRVRPGQRAMVSVEAIDANVPGTVESIGVLAESGGWRDPNRREYTVKVALDSDEQSTLKPSMRCEARLVLGEVKGALAVPVQAVFSDAAVAFVYVPKGTKFVRRPIVVGRRSDIYAEIAKGLEAGDRVLVRRPGPGEVIASEWDNDELVSLGYTIGEDGKARPPMSPAMMMRMAPGMSAPGGSTPGGAQRPQGRPGPSPGADRSGGAKRPAEGDATQKPLADAGKTSADAGDASAKDDAAASSSTESAPTEAAPTNAAPAPKSSDSGSGG
ncbi:MAG: HlyD family efflux transporter periplasmic adaptor subunit [Phycisphaerales bacterium]